jgi:purine-nucleoside phosphorylase
MKVVAVSVLTDECDPDDLKPVDIADIIAVAGKAELKLTTLFEKFIEQLDI